MLFKKMNNDEWLVAILDVHRVYKQMVRSCDLIICTNIAKGIMRRTCEQHLTTRFDLKPAFQAVKAFFRSPVRTALLFFQSESSYVLTSTSRRRFTLFEMLCDIDTQCEYSRKNQENVMEASTTPLLAFISNFQLYDSQNLFTKFKPSLNSISFGVGFDVFKIFNSFESK